MPWSTLSDYLVLRCKGLAKPRLQSASYRSLRHNTVCVGAQHEYDGRSPQTAFAPDLGRCRLWQGLHMVSTRHSDAAGLSLPARGTRKTPAQSAEGHKDHGSRALTKQACLLGSIDQH